MAAKLLAPAVNGISDNGEHGMNAEWQMIPPLISSSTAVHSRAVPRNEFSFILSPRYSNTADKDQKRSSSIFQIRHFWIQFIFSPYFNT